MKWRGSIIGLLILCAPTPFALAQSAMDSTSSQPYVPRLGDIMNAVQSRHMKLWFAGRERNWELATYELRQLRAGVVEAAMLYAGIPVSNVTTMSTPIESLSDAIAAKDSRRFAKAYGELTDGCNGCHQSMQRGFILIRVPTEQPFSDQVFPPKGGK
jgi:hypothetical protein